MPGISPVETGDFGDPQDCRNINTAIITIHADCAIAETSDSFFIDLRDSRKRQYFVVYHSCGRPGLGGCQVTGAGVIVWTLPIASPALAPSLGQVPIPGPGQKIVPGRSLPPS